MSEREDQHGERGGSEAPSEASERLDHPRAPELSESEEQQVEERATVPAIVVHEAIRHEGEGELARPSSALAWSGLAAGLSMGFSMATEGLLRTHLPDNDWRPLVAKLGYSVGFLLVVLGRQQLFTENTLTAVLPFLVRRDWRTGVNVIRLWSVVLATNLIGAFLFAAAIHWLPVFPPETMVALRDLARETMASTFWPTCARGIFAGWLIALMVWLLPVAETARVQVIIIITYIVGLAGFAHVIAGSVEAYFAGLEHLATWSEVLRHFVLPALLGNVLGGVSLVAVLNNAQVVSGRGGEGDESDQAQVAPPEAPSRRPEPRRAFTERPDAESRAA